MNAENVPFLDIISHPFLKLSVKPSPWLAPQKIEEGFSSYFGLFYKNVTDVTRVEFFVLLQPTATQKMHNV